MSALEVALAARQAFTNNASHVADIGRAGSCHNRLIQTGGSTLPTDIATAIWTAEQAVYACRFKVTGGSAGHRIRLCFDASPVDDISNVDQAANWLANPTVSATLDVEFFEVAQASTLNSNEWSDYFYFGAPLRRVDAISVDADVAQTIFIEVA